MYGPVVYTYVPRSALRSIRKFGLLSGDVLYRNRDILKLARPDRHDRRIWLDRYNDAKDDPDLNIVFKGPSVLFTRAPMHLLDDEHYIKRWSLVPIAIDLGAFVMRNPDTRIFGVELLPYDDDMTDDYFDRRERYITIEEVEAYTEQTPVSLWRHYSGDPKFYASDVPHAIVITPRIPAQFLKFPTLRA